MPDLLYPFHTGEVHLVVRYGQGSVNETAEWTDVHHILDCTHRQYVTDEI